MTPFGHAFAPAAGILTRQDWCSSQSSWRVSVSVQKFRLPACIFTLCGWFTQCRIKNIDERGVMSRDEFRPSNPDARTIQPGLERHGQCWRRPRDLGAFRTDPDPQAATALPNVTPGRCCGSQPPPSGCVLRQPACHVRESSAVSSELPPELLRRSAKMKPTVITSVSRLISIPRRTRELSKYISTRWEPAGRVMPRST